MTDKPLPLYPLPREGDSFIITNLNEIYYSKRNYSYKDYLVPIEQDDLAESLKTIIDASCPDNMKGRIVQLIVTMEYPE